MCVVTSYGKVRLMFKNRKRTYVIVGVEWRHCDIGEAVKVEMVWACNGVMKV